MPCFKTFREIHPWSVAFMFILWKKNGVNEKTNKKKQQQQKKNNKNKKQQKKKKKKNNNKQTKNNNNNKSNNSQLRLQILICTMALLLVDINCLG